MNSLSVIIGKVGVYLGFISLASFTFLTLMFFGTAPGTTIGGIVYLFLMLIFPLFFLILGLKGINLESKGDKKGLWYIFISSIFLSIPSVVSSYLLNNGIVERNTIFNILPVLFAPVPTMLIFISGVIGIFSQPKQ